MKEELRGKNGINVFPAMDVRTRLVYKKSTTFVV